MENNKVKVRIYGQEYTVSGERDEETILRIAEYVDQQMREIGKYYQGTQTGALATLAAVNIADEMYQKREELESMKKEISELKEECEHYMNMWEDAKKSFTQYKERANDAKEEAGNKEQRIKDLEAKISEFESAYFDLQMENIQLKNKLTKYE